jgi:hypothetical protein
MGRGLRRGARRVVSSYSHARGPVALIDRTACSCRPWSKGSSGGLAAYDHAVVLATVAATLGVCTAASALIATAVSLPFTPARYWSWRLRKHAETAAALGDNERYANQRAALDLRGDAIANNAAAAFRIPTDWDRFGFAMANVGLVAGVAATSFELQAKGQQYGLLSRWLWVAPFELMPGIRVPFIVVGIPVACLYVVMVCAMVRGFQSTHRERKRFISEGCPPNFVMQPMPWSIGGRYPTDADRDRAFRWQKATVRGGRLADAGTMPEWWKPRSRSARARRRFGAWRRSQPWYRGGHGWGRRSPVSLRDGQLG